MNVSDSLELEIQRSSLFSILLVVTVHFVTNGYNKFDYFAKLKGYKLGVS